MTQINRAEQLEAINIDEAVQNLTDWAVETYSSPINIISQSIATDPQVVRGGLSGKKILAVVNTCDSETYVSIHVSLETLIGNVAREAFTRGLVAGIEVTT